MRLLMPALVLLSATSCVSVEKAAPLRTCEDLIGGAARETEAQGFKPVQDQQEALGRLVVFTNGPTARLFYMTPSAGAAEFMVSKGWEHPGTCKASESLTIEFLRRDVALPAPAGDKA